MVTSRPDYSYKIKSNYIGGSLLLTLQQGYRHTLSLLIAFKPIVRILNHGIENIALITQFQKFITPENYRVITSTNYGGYTRLTIHLYLAI